MAPLIADMHAYLLPFVYFRRAKDRANFVGTMIQAYVCAQNGKMRLRIGIKTKKILLLLDRLALGLPFRLRLRLLAHYFITFHTRYTSRAIFSLSFMEPMSCQIFFCFCRLEVPSTVNIWLAARFIIGMY